MKGMFAYADVLLPVPLADSYTYGIPADLSGKVNAGSRVIVQFGKKWFTGIVISLHDNPPKGIDRIRDLEFIIDPQPVFSETQRTFWKWIADYYLCSLGDVYRAAVPAELRPEGDAPEKLIKLTAPREELYINLSSGYSISDRNKLIEQTKKSPRQRQLLEEFFRLLSTVPDDCPGVSKAALLKNTGPANAVLAALIKKEILITMKGAMTQDSVIFHGIQSPKLLSDRQQAVLAETGKWFCEKNVVLFHGVAASGKTEIYIHLIASQISHGKQCLYLLPEIALTAQIVERIKEVFGDKAGVYHSRYSEHQRSSIYKDLMGPHSRYSIVIGARSAIFLPFKNLGLVIIDEEHDSSYKQSDPAPRYHARDAAVILAGMTGAKVLMGTATPSFESYFNAGKGKYGLVQLKERYVATVDPVIHIADLKEAWRKKIMKSHFTPILLDRIEKHLAQDKQVILFQNRRGYAPFIQCGTCALIPKCKHCDVSLVYHKTSDRLVCHYCGFVERIPGECTGCGSTDLHTIGFGTEKIEDELGVLFPGSKTTRMDLDTTGTRRKYEKIISDFASGKVNILVGTQIITKGLDFGNVGLVGILNADNLFNFPDFRAFERSYQLLLQVAGRAGRREEAGEVIIQTASPDHPVISEILNDDYKGFYLRQMQERKEFSYPPYFRLIRLVLKHRDRTILQEVSDQLAWELRNKYAGNVLGPQFPLVSRVQNRYLMTILLKTSRAQSFHVIRNELKAMIVKKGYKSVQLIADVDPV
jgi:primosomal protein N' (replication factor Y)